jgi:transcriptional regulator with XRE-family HTH domain
MPRKNLKAARELAGYTQAQFAEALSIKVSPTTVCEWETQDNTIRPCYVRPIRAILGDDEHLLDSEPVNKGLSVPPCHLDTNRGIWSPQIPFLFTFRGLFEVSENLWNCFDANLSNS